MGHQAVATQTRLHRFEKGLGHAANIAHGTAAIIGTARTLYGAGRALAGVVGPAMAALAPIGL